MKMNIYQKWQNPNFWRGKKVLVTGGAGLIGSYLVEFLVDDGACVTVADNLERGRMENLSKVQSKIKFCWVDLKDYTNCKSVCFGQEIVMNLAAKVTGIEYNRTHQYEMFENNMLLQQNVIKAAYETKVKRFLQVSTACIYPHDAIVPTPEYESERGSPEPTNEGYGWAKRMGENLAKWYAQETDMKIAIGRPFNAYGIRDYFDKKTSHVIPALIRKVFNKEEPIEVWGSGNQSRVFVHAKDIAMGLKLITEKYAIADPVNIGHDNEITIKDLLAKIQKLMGTNLKVFYNTDMPEGYVRRAADITKFKAVTGGFTPLISLEEGLNEMIQWFKSLNE